MSPQWGCRDSCRRRLETDCRPRRFNGDAPIGQHGASCRAIYPCYCGASLHAGRVRKSSRYFIANPVDYWRGVGRLDAGHRYDCQKMDREPRWRRLPAGNGSSAVRERRFPARSTPMSDGLINLSRGQRRRSARARRRPRSERRCFLGLRSSRTKSVQRRSLLLAWRTRSSRRGCAEDGLSRSTIRKPREDRR